MVNIISVNGMSVDSARWYGRFGRTDIQGLLSVAGKLRDGKRTVSAAASKRAATKRRNIRARSKK